MGQVNGTESGDAYTVVIFRGSSAKPLRFSFPRKLVSRLLVVGAIFVLVDLLVLAHYVVRTGEVWELSSFRAEAMNAREQTGAFSGSIDDLKKRLASMKEVNQRIRGMLGIYHKNNRFKNCLWPPNRNLLDGRPPLLFGQ